MQNYKRLIYLSVVSIVVGLYFFITAITTKPVFNYIIHGQTSYSEYGIYYSHGTGIVSTSNKYKVKSATVRITIFDENDEVITSQFFDYSDHGLVEYDFKFTQNIPKRNLIEIYDAKIDNKLDIIISFILISFGVGYGVQTYIKDRNSFKGDEE